MRLCWFEDSAVEMLDPVTQTRPAFDLLCGATTLFEKQRRAFRPQAMAAFVRPHVSRVAAAEHGSVMINQSDRLLDHPLVLVNACWVPPRRFAPVPVTDGSYIAVIGDRVAYAAVQPFDLANWSAQSVDACLADWKSHLPVRQAVGRIARYPWDLVEWNGEEILHDFAASAHDDLEGRPSTLTLVGSSDLLRVDPTARIDPFVVVDTTAGPVIIGRDAVITSFTRIEGPCFIAPRTQIFGGNIRGGTSIGPNCRVGGEVCATVIQGNSNKAHEGYLGHSYVGEWVNLGAGTHASDLRNDYADIMVHSAGKVIATKTRRVGAFIGDHVKAGVGSRINAGSSFGPFAQLLPSGSLLPKYVPAFCTVEHGRVVETAELGTLFEAAERVTASRGEEFADYHRALFRNLYERGRAQRQIAIHEAELRRLRRAA